MTSDDQQFLDLLASVPQGVAHHGGRLADYIERHANSIASDIRDAIDSASWIPDVLRPPRASGTHHFFSKAPPPPSGVYERTTAWISRNRTAIAIAVAFTGTTVYLVHRKKKAHARKRRAKKLANGAKKEIVVIACSTFHDPLTKSLALDLERRGYVVYITVSSTEEDSLVQQEAKTDLRPLWMDLTSTVPNPAVDIHPNLEAIRELITKNSRSASPSSGRAGSGAALSNLSLAGVVVFPGCTGYPMGNLATMQPSDVVDTINTRLMAPVLTIQQFMPLLTTNTSSNEHSSIIIAYPSISTSLSSPGQCPEAIVTSSLSALAASLRREISTTSSNLTVTELRLGNFDLGSVAPKNNAVQSTHQSVYGDSSQLDPENSALTHWHSSQRAAIERSRLTQKSLIKGSSAREFHNAVFDALAPPQTFKAFGKYEWQTRKRSDIVFVGSGARLYAVIGTIMPQGLVGWMMGYRAGNKPLSNSSSESKHVTPKQSQHLPAWGSNSANSESGIWEKV